MRHLCAINFCPTEDNLCPTLKERCVENIPFSDNNETRLTDKCDSKEVTPAQDDVTPTSHKLSYADIVKGKNDMNLDDSSHSFKLIQ